MGVKKALSCDLNRVLLLDWYGRIIMDNSRKLLQIMTLQMSRQRPESGPDAAGTSGFSMPMMPAAEAWRASWLRAWLYESIFNFAGHVIER